MSVLMLDLDGKFGKRKKNLLAKKLVLLSKYFNFEVKNLMVKPTKRGWHVRIEVDRELDDRDVVFFQLFLGSDWRREFWNWLRVKHNWKPYNVLFKEKYRFKGKNLILVSRERDEV